MLVAKAHAQSGRTIVVLVLAWIAAAFAAVTSIASYLTPGELILLDLDRGGVSLFLGSAMLFAALAVFTIDSLLPRASLSGTFLKRLASPRLLAALMEGLGVVELTLVSRDGMSSPVLDLAVIGLVAVTGVWFFCRRDNVPHKLLAVSITWGFAVILVRQILVLLRGNVDLAEASWWMRVYTVVHMAVFLVLLLAPLLALEPRIRSAFLKLLSAYHRVPFWLWSSGLPILAGLALLPVVFPGVGIRATLVAKTSALATLAAIPLFLGRRKPASPSLKRIGPSFSNGAYRWSLLLILALYGLASIRIHTRALENVNPDALGYMTISREYAEGMFPIRGYWAPLISWLMAPVIALGVDPRVAFRAVLGVTGAGLIIVTQLLGSRAGLARPSRTALALATAFLLLQTETGPLTPDLLGAVVVAMYLYFVSSPSIVTRPIVTGAIAGLLAALAYYAKHYNILFCGGHLFITGIFLAMGGARRRDVIRSIGVGLLTLAATTLPWILALSNRYSEFTLTTSAGITRSVVGPGSNGYACWASQLCPEPSDVLLPVEDPDPQYYTAYNWSPFSSLGNLWHQILLTRDNVWRLPPILSSSLGPLPLAAGVAAGIASLIHWQRRRLRLRCGWVFATLSLFPLGYLLSYSSEFRHYLPLAPVFLVATFRVIQIGAARLRMLHSSAHPATVRAITLTLVALPILGVIRPRDLSAAWTASPNPCMRIGAAAIAPYLEAPIAGVDAQVQYISYYARVRTFGVLPPEITPEDADLELRQLGVRTLLVPVYTEMARRLGADYGYEVVARQSVCDTLFAVLRVPG